LADQGQPYAVTAKLAGQRLGTGRFIAAPNTAPEVDFVTKREGSAAAVISLRAGVFAADCLTATPVATAVGAGTNRRVKLGPGFAGRGFSRFETGDGGLQILIGGERLLRPDYSGWHR
jgi:hypothetical protein